MQNEHPRLDLVPLGLMAARLGIPPTELRQDVEDGGLPAVRVGKRGLLFHVATVERLLRERAEQAGAGTCDSRASADHRTERNHHAS